MDTLKQSIGDIQTMKAKDVLYYYMCWMEKIQMFVEPIMESFGGKGKKMKELAQLPIPKEWKI